MIILVEIRTSAKNWEINLRHWVVHWCYITRWLWPSAWQCIQLSPTGTNSSAGSGSPPACNIALASRWPSGWAWRVDQWNPRLLGFQSRRCWAQALGYFHESDTALNDERHDASVGAPTVSDPGLEPCEPIGSMLSRNPCQHCRCFWLHLGSAMHQNCTSHSRLCSDIRQLFLQVATLETKLIRPFHSGTEHTPWEQLSNLLCARSRLGKFA